MRFDNRWFQTLTLLSLLVLVACGGGGGGSSGGGGGGSNTPPLVITTTSLPDASEATEYSAQLTASGGTPPYAWNLGGGLPGNLSLSPLGTISGTPYESGGFDLILSVTDSSAPLKGATTRIHLNVLAPFDIYTTDLPSGHTNVVYDAIIQPLGAAQSWQITAGQLPPGLQSTNASLTQIEITGTPTTAGSFTFTIQATSTDNPPRLASKNFTIAIDSNAAITTSSLPDLITQRPYDVTLSAVNGTLPYHWSVLPPGLPNGLNLNADTGEVSGTYSQGIYQNPYPIVFQVTDSAANPTSSTRSLPVHMLDALNIYGSYYQNATQRQQYFGYLGVSGGTYPYAWSIASGNLPPGLKLDQSGSVNGTPTTLGTYNFTVQVTDSTSPQQTAQSAQTITVSPPALLVMPSLPGRLPLNVAFDGFIAAQGGTPPYTWSLSNGSLPPGLQLNTATGEVSGTPSTAGTYSFAAQVVDSASQTAYQGYTILVDTALGRNDTIAKATPLGNSTLTASISPYADPVDTANPDTDYYKIYATPGTPVLIRVSRVYDVFDPVLELVDANGVQLNTCDLPPLFNGIFASSCMNDDVSPGIDRDSMLQIKLSGNNGTQVIFYAHVLDWRGDARPDMQYYIWAQGAVDPLAIDPIGLGVGTNGVAYNQQLTSRGGTGTVTWTLVQGPLPPGLALDSSGVIAGTPTANGDFDFTVQATDAGNPAQVTSHRFTIAVSDPVKLTNLDQIPTGCVGQLFSFQPVVTGGTPPYNWSFQSPDSDGIGQDWMTGQLRGTPLSAGTFQLGIGAGDRYFRSDYHLVTWTVNSCQ